ncbi:substrate-binding domain-containing protein [Christiangramia portivictoriae]|uniref:substrate-binding domain-containing protein n=1 Tax=Christiangramia portivictoriae TaxID=326069 RepID=UPI0003FFD4C8|nr:substrate-binding domain-containing protein [Christiangramia portivictoriae]
MLVAGKETYLSEIEDLIARDELVELEKALIKNTWYSASNDMDHFRRFWFENFKRRADFKPNYILPNIGSILRSIKNNDGFAIVPDFLAQESLQAGKIQLVWAGVKEVSNILYFATRKDLKYK